VYHIEIYLEKTPLDFFNLHPEKTGFQVKYAGPDTEDSISVVPASKLFRESKTSKTTYVNPNWTTSSTALKYFLVSLTIGILLLALQL
jgi:hypothetical protein